MRLVRQRCKSPSRVLGAFIVCCCVWTPLSAVERSEGALTLNTPKLVTLRPLLNSWVANGDLPNAAVLVLYRGQVVFEHHTGTLDIELGTPVARDSLYRIYSMTKPITSVAAMSLVEQGKLTLDGPITAILPEFETLEVYVDGNQSIPANSMSLRHLLSHTSGIVYGYDGNSPVDRLYRQYALIDDWDYLVPTTHDLVVGLGTLPLLFQPGERYHYGFSTDVVAEVVTRVSGMKLDAYLEQLLWTPLGVEDAFFDVPDDALDRFGTNQYRTSGGKFVVQDTPRVDPEFRDVTFLSG